MSTVEPVVSEDVSEQKQSLLLAFYQTSWNEMTWRRNAGYRTIILGFGYFGLLLTLLAFNPHATLSLRLLLAAVLVIGTLFGAGYLVSNYRKYMDAAAMTVKIEQYVGAYNADFLGSLGALMPPQRRQRPSVPLARDAVCFWSVVAFGVGGVVTAIAICVM
jgi:hypothetical protein